MLAHAVGPQQATLACLFGETWNAEEAHRAGLVAEVIDDPVAAALLLGQRLAGQERAYVERLTATLRGTLSTQTYADALAAETQAQRWSATRPAFLDGVADIMARISRRG
jgi:enoyl-CoA hydratase